MVRPEDIGRSKQSHLPCDGRHGPTASGDVAFIELGTRSGGSIGHRCCSMGFWHEMENVDQLHQLDQQLLQHQQQQQQRHRRLQSATVASLPPLSTSHVDQEKDRRPSVTAVRSLTRQLDQQRLTDDDDDDDAGRVRAVTVMRMRDDRDDPVTGRESDEVDSGTATDDDDAVALGGTDLLDDPPPQSPGGTEAKVKVRFSAFSSEHTLFDDHLQVTTGLRSLVPSSFNGFPWTAQARPYDCCSSLNFLLATASNSPTHDDPESKSDLMTSPTREFEVGQFGRLPDAVSTACPSNVGSHQLTGSSGPGNRSAIVSFDRPSHNVVRHRPTPASVTSSVAVISTVVPDSSHGRSVSSMPASPSSSSSFRFQFGARLNGFNQCRGLNRSASVDDEPRWPFAVDRRVEDVIEGATGSSNHQARSIADVARKRRTGGAEHSPSQTLELPRRYDVGENCEDANEDVCDEEVSGLLGVDGDFPYPLSSTNGPRNGRPSEADVRDASPSVATPGTHDGVINEETQHQLQRQRRYQSPCKRRRSNEECRGSTASTSTSTLTSSTHRPSLDLYKMQRLSRWRRRHRTISSAAHNGTDCTGSDRSSPKPIPVVFQPIISSSDPPSPVSPIMMPSKRELFQFPVIQFVVV